MNRMNKKMKLESSSGSWRSSSIHSGNYMTSSLHENEDEEVEMPIASPDATNNDVTVNTINAEQDHDESLVVADDKDLNEDHVDKSKIKSIQSSPAVSAPVPILSHKSRILNKKLKSRRLSATELPTNTVPVQIPTNISKQADHDHPSHQISKDIHSNVAVSAPNNSQLNDNPNNCSSSYTSSSNDLKYMSTSNNQTSGAGVSLSTLNRVNYYFNTNGYSISGGLTLDKQNKSLKNLIYYIKTAYSNNLTSPKWKNFKGLKLQVVEKIRLNNVIWRTWFEQYGTHRDSNTRRKRPTLVCQFANGLDDELNQDKANSAASKAANKAIEGKYWKRRLDSITNEYKKWREISRKQIKPSSFKQTTITSISANSGSGYSSSVSSIAAATSSSQSTSNNAAFLSLNNSANIPNITITSNSSSNISPNNLNLHSPSAQVISGPPISITTSPNYNSMNVITQNVSSSNQLFNNNTLAGSTISNQQISPGNLLQYSQTVAYSSTNNNFNNNFYDPNQINPQNFNNNSANSYNNQNNQFNQQLNNYSNTNYSGINDYSSFNSANPSATYSNNFSTYNPSGYSGTSSYTSVSNQQSFYNPAQSSITSKQGHNRCRSPSPGLFQDFDLYNFSSDTLFSTYLVEDQKDPIFGTNPDLFQPDLMHLYPNFDFFELDIAGNAASNSNSCSNSNQTSPPPDNNNVNNQIDKIDESTLNVNNGSANTDTNVHTNTTDSLVTTTRTSPTVLYQEETQRQQPQQSIIPIDYSDLSNFNTLASVAAAQTSQNVQNNSQQQSIIVHQGPAKSLNVASLLKANELNHQNQSLRQSTSSRSSSKTNPNDIELKLPVSLSQLNSSLNHTDTIQSVIQSVSHAPPSSPPTSMASTQITNAPNVISNQTSSSSNTIRNLLAQQSPIMSTLQSSLSSSTNGSSQINSKNQLVNNNLRISGVLSAASATIPMRHHHQHHQINTSPTNHHQTDTKQKQSKTDNSSSNNNQQLSALLSVVLSPNTIKQQQLGFGATNETVQIDNSSKQSVNSLSSAVVPSQTPKRRRKNNQQQQQQPQQPAPPPPPPQQIQNPPQITRSNSKAKLADMVTNMNKSNTASKKINIDQIPDSYDSNTASANTTANHNGKNQFFLQNLLNMGHQQSPQPLSQQISYSNSSNSNTGLVVNESSNSNSAVNSPAEQSLTNNSFNHTNSFQSGPVTFTIGPAPTTIPYQQSQSIESDYMPKSNMIKSQKYSSSALSSMASTSTSAIQNETGSPSPSSSFSATLNNTPRAMSRSNSVNSINTMTTDGGISSAEQKRRCNIQHGFDRLQVLVPALKDGKNSKASKAVMLQKTSEYIKELQIAREKRMADLDVYKKEIDELSEKISECQNQLPANGVSVVGSLNKTEVFEQKFNTYVKEKTVENWKFYLFSLILKPLFDNFLTTLNTSSKEDMERTFYEWQQRYCSLSQLRPIASNALRHLSKSTSILSDSSKLPEECYSAALTRI